MKKENFKNSEINLEDYIDQGNNENRKTRKSKKKIVIPAAATLLSLAVAASAIGISFASPLQNEDAAETQTAFLSLAAPTAQEQKSGGVYLMDVSEVVDETLPAVVSITSRSLVNYYGNRGGYFEGDLRDIFEYFFGESFGGRDDRRYEYETPEGPEYYEEEYGESFDEEADEIESGIGSGTIVSKTDDELLILTSYHVVEDSSSLYVTFINDVSVDGYIKSADEDKDIAIVAVPLADIDQETMDSIKVASVCTEKPEVGDGVIVIGNALGYGISVTTGIVSALDREIYVEGKNMQVIQTDAAINWGNSGGCMLNSKGEIIGINEAKATISYVEGMCYSIPIYSNLELIQNLLNSEGITSSKEEAYVMGAGPFLGIRGRDVTKEVADDFGMPQGVYVASSVEGSGAYDAGILGGDIIVGFDGKEITSMEELQTALAEHEAGDKVTLEIKRMTDGEYVSQEMEVVLSDRIS